MADIDQLSIEINAQVNQAVGSIDTLLTKLTKLNNSLTYTNRSGLTGVANGVQRLGAAMQTMNTIKTTDFTRLAKNLQKLGTIDTASMNKTASAVNQITKSFNGLTSLSKSTEQLVQLANGIKQLGYKSATNAIANMPKLATSMKGLMQTLSTAPKVSQNLINMTNALAKLSRTGASSGKAASSLAKSLNTYTVSTNKASKGSFNLASAIGKVYATYWLLFRAFGKIRDAINISSDLTEVQNVVDVTFGNMAGKVEELAQTSIEQFGLSELSLKQYASRFQAMGSAMGIDKSLIGNANKYLSEQTNGYVGLSDSMADVSLNLTKLTADMASFYNVEQSDVAEDLESIFTGQTRPLRQYGLDLTQATLSEWAMKQGLDANIQSMSQAEKTMLRYQYVLANTGAAQGDFARTADTWANQTRILKQNFEQLASVLGGVFINALKPLVKALNNAMSHIIAFAKTISNALGKIFGWTYEESGGGITMDMEDTSDALTDASGGAGNLSDNLGQAAENAKKLKSYTLGIDELNVISPDNESPSGVSGGSGGSTGSSGGTGSSSEGTLGGQWVKGDSILKQFESGIDSLYELGEYIGDVLTKTLNSIQWNKVYEGAKNFGKGLADFLNGLISPELFGAVGRTIAGALNTAIYAALSFGEAFDWTNYGLSIATGINEFFDTFDFGALARAINTWANGILDTIIEFLGKTNWSMIGEKIGTFLADIDFIGIGKKMGKALWEAINAGIELFAKSFSKAPIETVLVSLATIPKLLKKITASKFVTGIKKLVTQFMNFSTNTKPVVSGLMGNKDSVIALTDSYPKLGKVIDVVSDSFWAFKTGISDKNIFTGLSLGIENIRNNLTGLQKGAITAVAGFAEFSIVSNTFEGLVNGSENVVAGIAKIGATVAAAGVAFSMVFSPPAGIIIAGITAAIAALKGWNDAQQEAKETLAEQEELALYGDSLTNITTRLNEAAQATKERMKASMEYAETAGIAETMMAQDLSNRYFDLAEKESLTNEEKAEMQRLAATLVETIPGLQEFYNTETGLIDRTRQSVNELIEARLQEIQLNAAEEKLTEAYKERIDTLEKLDEAAEVAGKSQGEMLEAQTKYDEASGRLNALRNYNTLQEYISAGADKTGAMVEEQQRLREELESEFGGRIPTMAQLEADAQIAEQELNDCKVAYDEAMNSFYEQQEARDIVEGNIAELSQMIRSGMQGAGEEFGDGYIEGIKSKEEAVIANAKSLAALGAGSVQTEQESGSPSEVTRRLGKDFVDGYKLGIEENISIIKVPIDSMMNSVKGWMVEGINSIITSIPQMMSGVWDGIKGVFAEASAFFSGTFTNAYNAIKSAFQLIPSWFQEKWNAVKLVFAPTVEFFSKTFTSAYESIKRAFQLISSWFQEKWNAVKNVFSRVKQFFQEKFTSGYNAVRTAFNPIDTWFRNKWDDVKTVFGDVEKFFENGFQKAYNAVTKIWDGIGKYFKDIANDIIKPVGKAVNGVIDGINWIFGEVGSKTRIDAWDVPQFARGTDGLPQDTLGMVNDQKGSIYRELIVPPHGRPFIPEGRNVLLPMEKGTKIMPAKRTKQFMDNIPHFAKGIGDFFGNSWLKSEDFTGNIRDYITEPGKIVQIAIDKFTDFSNVGSFFIPLATGAISKVFDSVVEYVKKLFDSIGIGGIESAVKWAIGIALDDSHGYDQASRWGNPDYDCSSLVISAFEQAGIKMKSAGATYTGNMYEAARRLGFSDVTSSVNRSTGAGLERGDILLNRKNHTAIYIGNGQVVQASSNENRRITGGKPGDQTGREIWVGPYYNYPWDDILRFVGKFKEGIGKIGIPDLIPTFSTGGFPEDGLFYANHGELIGKFGNGRTAVVNNEQIVKSVSDGVASAVRGQNTETNQLLRQVVDYQAALLRKDNSINVDGKKMDKQLSRARRNAGFSFSPT